MGSPDGLRDRIREQNRLYLRTSPWLAELAEASHDRLAAIALRQIHSDGAALFRQGDESDRVWLICSGAVQASVIGPGGKELVIHVAGPGETPGETDLIDGGPRSVDAIVVGTAETLALPVAAVREELLSNPAALMRLSVNLVGIIRVLDAAVADQALLDLDGRLAKFLLSKRNGGNVVRLGANQSAVASQMGVARQSLNRSLAALIAEGLITVASGGREIRVLDEDGLLSIASGQRPRRGRGG